MIKTLDLNDSAGVKPLPTNLIKNMLNNFFQEEINKRLNLIPEVSIRSNINSAIIHFKNNKDAEVALPKINLEILSYMKDYIELITGESCKNYNRNVNLYESKIEQGRLLLTWY